MSPSGDVDDVGTIDLVDMDLWGFDLSSRRWSQYGDTSSLDDDSYLDDTVDHEEDSHSVISQDIAVGGGSATGVSGNNKWWVGVAGDLPAARYQHGLSVWRGVDGTEHPFLVCFGGERSDTPWDLKQGSNLRTSNIRETVSTGSDQTAIDDDFFSGAGSGGSDNDNNGILGPISSHAQSNDLWLFPLPAGNTVDTFYDGDSKSLEDLMISDSIKDVGNRVLSGGADSSNKGSGRRGRINGGNSPRHRMPPKRHSNSSSSNPNDNSNNNNNNNNNDKNDSDSNKNDTGTGPGTGTGSGGKIAHGNGTARSNITDPSVDERYGWTLLSAGGCHYLDDGRYDMSLILIFK